MKILGWLSMKILILATSPGKISQYASQLSNALAKKYPITVILNSEIYENIYDDKVNVIEFSFKKYLKFPSPFSYYKLYKIIKSINPDIIHDPIGPAFYWTTGILPFLKKWKLAVTIHDPKPHSGMKHPFQNFFTLLNIKFADIIFVHGENNKNDIISFGFSNKDIIVIPHGTFDFFDKTSSNIQEEENCVLFFGALRPNKGIGRLFDIANSVRKKVPNVKFLIAGSSKNISRHINQEKIRETMDKLKKSDLFEVYDDYIPNEDVEIYFRRAAVVILPYYDATQSGIVPIAYHFKKPVVATRVGDLSEVVLDGQTGYLANSNSNQDIADKIVKLLKNSKLRKSMGQNGYKLSITKLSWGSVVNDTIEAYKNILKV